VRLTEIQIKPSHWKQTFSKIKGITAHQSKYVLQDNKYIVFLCFLCSKIYLSLAPQFKNPWPILSFLWIYECGSTGSPWDTSGPRSLVTRPTKLFVNLLRVTTSLFIFFMLENLKKIVILILSAALCTSATHAILFKPWYKMYVFKVKCVRYKLLQEQI
jgi:hypothetical protein